MSIGINIKGVDPYTQTQRSPSSLKKLNNTLPILNPITSSSYLKSFVSLFIIRPTGILLKKFPKLAYSKALLILL